MLKLDSNSIKTVCGLSKFKKLATDSLRLSLYEVGKDIKSEAKRSILEPPKTGRLYRLRLRGVMVSHRASAPGEAPADFTGDLRKSVDYRVKGSTELRISAGSQKVHYAGTLEFGGDNGVSKILPRPYLRPAIVLMDRNINTRIGKFIIKRVSGLTS